MAAPQTSIRFKAILQRPGTPTGATWAFVVLPAAASAKLPSRGQVAVAGTVGACAFTAMLEPDGARGHWFKVGKALREKAGIGIGDVALFELVPSAEPPEARVPADLRAALSANSGAGAQWKTLTPVARRDFIQWVTTAKQAATRARRIANGCDMLASGKRRICCFDRSGIYSRGNMGAPQAAND